MHTKNTKLLSVIIPTYNQADYIRTALDSVLSQRLPADWEIEVLVIDDGSTDDTVAIIKGYGKKVQLFHIKHSGKPAVARNIGLKSARGSIIAFQDSDDIWEKDKLIRQLPFFADANVMLTYGHTKTINQTGVQSKNHVLANRKLMSGEKFESLIKENVISTLTVMVRQPALDKVGIFNETDALSAVEDYDLWLRIAAAFPDGIKSVDETLALYRVHDANSSKADGLLATERHLALVRRLWDEKLSVQQRVALEEQITAYEEAWSFYQKEAGKIPTISVVLSIYQAEKHLRPALEGILNQTFKDFEFIIIDDGCTDRSAKIVRSYKDSRIRFVQQTNHGLVYSLNKGIQLARAPYIARQDADDISKPARLAAELKWLSVNPERGVVGTFFTYIDEVTSKPGTTITSPTEPHDLRRMLRIVNPLAHGSTLSRKEAILSAGGYKDNYGPTEDYELWSRIAQNWDIGQIPKSLYLYRINPRSISHINKDAQHMFAKQISDDLWRKAVPRLSFVSIIRNAIMYKRLPKYGEDIYNQYVHQQILFAFESLVRGNLREGYESVLAATLLKPLAAIRLWKIVMWAPFKLLLGRQII